MSIVETGINGLDEILDGGFMRPSIVLIAGAAGTGKTTFVTQSLFNSAKKDELCIYITSLSEPIEMINNFMSRYSFYDKTFIDQKNIKYLPLDIEIINKGHNAIIEEIEKNIEKIKPDRIVIDPANVFTLGMAEEDKRKFYYELFTKMKSWNTLVLLTGEFTREKLIRSTIGYLVDGIIYLGNVSFYDKNIRYLNVLKMRGQNYNGGKHSVRIDNNGFTVFPKLHAPERNTFSKERVSSGTIGLDLMLEDGFIRGSSIIVSGCSGTGKTIMGLQFIMDGLMKGESGVIVSLEEDAIQIRENSKKFGWELEKYEKNNLLKIICPYKLDVYELALLIDISIKEIKAKRLFFDGTGILKTLMPKYTQLSAYIYEFVVNMKHKGLTSIYTNETSNIIGEPTVSDGGDISVTMDAIILLRYVEIESSMKKAISILKMRGSNHNKDIKEIIIDNKGLRLADSFAEYTGLMSGNPKKVSYSDYFVEAFKKKQKL